MSGSYVNRVIFSLNSKPTEINKLDYSHIFLEKCDGVQIKYFLLNCLLFVQFDTFIFLLLVLLWIHFLVWLLIGALYLFFLKHLLSIHIFLFKVLFILVLLFRYWSLFLISYILLLRRFEGMWRVLLVLEENLLLLRARILNLIHLRNYSFLFWIHNHILRTYSWFILSLARLWKLNWKLQVRLSLLSLILRRRNLVPLWSCILLHYTTWLTFSSSRVNSFHSWRIILHVHVKILLKILINL